MRVLVTGGAGFIGSHLIDRLRADGVDVVCVDSLDPAVYQRPPDYLRDDVEYQFSDLRWWRPAQPLDDVEAVVHLAALGGVSRAAREPANLIDANVRGTARLVELARQLPRLKVVVLGSSFSVYGASFRYSVPSSGQVIDGERRPEDLEAGRFEVYAPESGETAAILPITEDAPARPLETYGASKLMQELCFAGFNRCPVYRLRFSSVYGTRLRTENEESTIIARLLGWIAAGTRPPLYEDGRQIRDWVHVDDVVEAIVALVAGRTAPPLLNVCSGSPTSLVEACRLIGERLGADCPPEIVGGFRPGDMRHCLGDASRLTRLLGRAPLTFAEGIRRLA